MDLIIECLKVEVTGKYEKGEAKTFDHPGCPDRFLIHHVYVGSVDIVSELDSDTIDDLEKQALSYRE